MIGVREILVIQNLYQNVVSFSESEDDSSDEEEFMNLILLSQKIKLNTPQRIENYLERIVPGLNAQQFQEHFRMTVDAYESLLGLIGPQLERQSPVGRFTINVEKQILAVVWLLATPKSYMSVGERFNLAKSSLSMCFIRVVILLNSIASQVIKWPEGQRLIEIQRKFYNISNLPNVIGAVDGTYIKIKAPKEDPQSYITRKCNYAFTLQAISEPNLKFTDVFIGYPGSVSDIRIFRNSDIYRAIRNNILHYFPDNSYIIGDKAYPVLPWCIPPYINRGNLTRTQIYFNSVHAKTRQVIERSFALLFGRFRRLKFLDMNRNDLVPGTVVAACVLHNICLNHHDIHIEDYIQQGVPNIVNEENNLIINNIQIEEDGRFRRNQISRELYANRN